MSAGSDLQELLPVGGEMRAFHAARHGPFAADAGGGVEERAFAHAVVGHPLQVQVQTILCQRLPNRDYEPAGERRS
jgi:hypothetical protein